MIACLCEYEELVHHTLREKEQYASEKVKIYSGRISTY